MRLFLLPISTRRVLIYCQRLNVAAPEKQTWADWGTSKATKLWAGWEKRESGWQRKVVDYGNYALKRIPYEEWGLKSIPPISARKKEISAGEKVEVFFPSTVLPEQNILEVLKKLGTERQSLHQKRLIWSCIGMPISAPFAIVPVVPNLPFFYLVFRAWSHWRALSGSKHIEFLLKKELVTPKPSKILDLIYADKNQPFNTALEKQTNTNPIPNSVERMIIHKGEAKQIAEALSMPELDIELDRAIWQVDKSIQAEKKTKEEKEIEKAQSKQGEKKK
ncbi:hypothetical protein HYALB_00000123 [Hymenoscyphus albidus]|uniref:Mitochondrial K+-H+ exchange-related-domain-containing protein n=1 Tax=Hymenoscyphus albidus TaxID=595503 RepID=A0A9N9LHS6_9HELO|nr:hypothetical protein HYALB_00000123 [Hymenoscyphus albidus]